MNNLHKPRDRRGNRNKSVYPCSLNITVLLGRAMAVILSLCLFGVAGLANATSWNLRAHSWHAPVIAHHVVTHTYAQVRTNSQSNGILGSWKNTNRNTRGLTRIDITQDRGGYHVHAWGRCHPRDCDWGNTVAIAYSANTSSSSVLALNVTFQQSTGSITLLLRRNGARINADMMRAFNSRHAAGRKNYIMAIQLVKANETLPVSTGGTPSPQTPQTGNGSASAGSKTPSHPGSGVEGRFRVVVTGFTVNQQTWDDALNRDGKGDEVFILTHVAELNAKGGTVISSDPRSRIMGDTNGWHGRVHAGTAYTGPFGGPRGGLATGDQYPSSHPWQIHGKAYDDRAPELVWQGTLKQGDGGVLITPTIWEWDMDGGDMLLRDWSAVELKLNDLAGKLLNTVSGGATKPFVEGDKALWGLLKSNELARALGHAATRPIGLQEDSKGHQKFQPTIIKLTYDTAMQVLKNNFGKGRGVLEIQYRDSARLHGDYTLYVKVQKI